MISTHDPLALGGMDRRDRQIRWSEIALLSLMQLTIELELK